MPPDNFDIGFEYRPKPARSRLVWILAALFCVLLAVPAVWFIFQPEDLVRMKDRVLHVKPLVHSLTVTVNNETRLLRPGQFTVFHPADTFRVDSFESNHWKNYDLRLYSPDLDLNAVAQPTSLLRSLGEEAFTSPRQFVIQVKDGPVIVASFFLLVSMSTDDWVTKAAKAEQPEDKVRYYRLALEFDPKNTDVKKQLAAALEASGNFQGAADIYEREMGDRPDPAVLSTLLTIYRRAGDVNQVVHTYHRLIQVSPDDAAQGLLRELARLHEDRGEIEEAVKAYRILITRLPQEQTAGVLKEIGFLYANHRLIDQAIQTYEEAARLDEKDANIFFNLARLYQTQGNQDKYLENMSKALTLDPTDANARLKLADTYLNAGQKDQAEKELRAVLDREPDNLDARLRLVKLLEDRQAHGELIAHYEYLLDKAPDNKVLRYNLGVLYYEANRLNDAEKMMNETVRQDPQDIDARRYLFEIYQKQNNPDAAAAQAQDLIRLDPNQLPLFDFLFSYLDDRRSYDTMAGMVKEWITLHPRETKFREYLAYAQIKMNKLEDAAQTYEELAGLKTGDVDVLFKLAKIYEGLGRLKEAKRTYARILEIDPSNERAAEAHLNLAVESLEVQHGQ